VVGSDGQSKLEEVIMGEDPKLVKIYDEDEVLRIITRISGMFGAVIYLMGGGHHTLQYEFADFELWICDIRDNVDRCIEIIEDKND
jgi:hypothetical protein